MNHKRVLSALVFAMVCAIAPSVHAEDAGVEWITLVEEAGKLSREGNYDRGVVVAQKALEIAERNVGPDHPGVAVVLEKYATLLRATKRDAEADAMEQRVARIRALER
jgi:hypothetical protein